MKRLKKARESKAEKLSKQKPEQENAETAEIKRAFQDKVVKKSPRLIKYPVLSAEIRVVFDFFRDLEHQYEMCSQDYESYENECQDLNHGIEFGWIGNHRKSCYTALENSRINRRTAKNRRELMTKVMEFMDNYPNLINDLSDLLGWVKRKEEQQALRGYSPRTEILDKVTRRYEDEN